MDWDAVVWVMIAAGLVVFGAFLVWQSRNTAEPLVPLHLFGDRNFSLANVAIMTIGFSITAMAFPLMIWAQTVRGYSPTRAALLLVPMAVISGCLAPWVGKLTDRVHPRLLVGIGLTAFPVALAWLAMVLSPEVAVWRILLPIALLGIANGFMWAPLGSTATENLPMHQAGAGAGIYNTTRQMGAVLGSAAIAVLMQARLSAEVPGLSGRAPGEAGAAALPEPLRQGYSDAMAQSLLLPALVLLLGLVAVMFFATPRHMRPS
jgi:MFS family permease